MKNYNFIEIDHLFDEVFSYYPSRDKPSSAKKAFTVALKKGIEYDDIKASVQIYALETQGDEYHYHFSNFLNEDHYKDYLDSHKDPATYLKRLQDEKDEALNLIEEWNEACRPHWCRCLHSESRIKLVLDALRDKAFKDNWREALKIARSIFRRPLPNDNYLSRTNLTLKWFTKIGEQHTVIRLMEGEFGKAKPYEIKERKEEKPRQISDEEQKELNQMCEEIIKDLSIGNFKVEEFFSDDADEDPFEFK